MTGLFWNIIGNFREPIINMNGAFNRNRKHSSMSLYATKSLTLMNGRYLKHFKRVSIEVKPLHSNCAQYITPQWTTNEFYMRPFRVFEHASCFSCNPEYVLVKYNPMNEFQCCEWIRNCVLSRCICHVLFVMRRRDLWLSHESNSTPSVQWNPCSHLFHCACSCRLQLCRLMNAATLVCLAAHRSSGSLMKRLAICVAQPTS